MHTFLKVFNYSLITLQNKSKVSINSSRHVTNIARISSKFVQINLRPYISSEQVAIDSHLERNTFSPNPRIVIVKQTKPKKTHSSSRSVFDTNGETVCSQVELVSLLFGSGMFGSEVQFVSIGQRWRKYKSTFASVTCSKILLENVEK